MRSWDSSFLGHRFSLAGKSLCGISYIICTTAQAIDASADKGLRRKAMSERQGPLAGVRVLDASRVLAGPFCGQILGDLGAEVLKIERPGSGDGTRGWGPPFAGSLSAYFLSCNRNKRSLTLDLAHSEGQRLFHELARRSDVLLEKFRADSAERLGMSPSQLLAKHPQLIICSISGFGRTSTQRDVPGYDF